MTDSKALTISDEGKRLAMIALDYSSWAGPGVPEEAVAMACSLADACAAVEAQMIPLKQVEPDGVAFNAETDRFQFTGARSKVLADGLRPIGIKISGRMSSGEANAWLASMILALSDLPFAYLRKAIEEVIHVPMKFLNEVETEIRIKAKASASRHNLALMNLNKLQREIDRAGNEPLALPSPDRIDGEALQNMVEPLRRIGLQAGWLTQDDEGIISWKEGG